MYPIFPPAVPVSIRQAIIVMLLIVAGAGPLAAQGPRQEFASAADDRSPRPIPGWCTGGDPAPLVVGGLLGGVAGIYAGALTLSAVTKGSDEDGDLIAALVGATIGEIAGVAMGAHLANRSRGDPLATFAASAAGFALGALITSNVHDRLDWLAVPLVQLPLTVIVERRSAGARAATQPACAPI